MEKLESPGNAKELHLSLAPERRVFQGKRGGIHFQLGGAGAPRPHPGKTAPALSPGQSKLKKQELWVQAEGAPTQVGPVVASSS